MDSKKRGGTMTTEVIKALAKFPGIYTVTDVHNKYPGLPVNSIKPVLGILLTVGYVHKVGTLPPATVPGYSMLKVPGVAQYQSDRQWLIGAYGNTVEVAVAAVSKYRRDNQNDRNEATTKAETMLPVFIRGHRCGALVAILHSMKRFTSLESLVTHTSLGRSTVKRITDTLLQEGYIRGTRKGSIVRDPVRWNVDKVASVAITAMNPNRDPDRKRRDLQIGIPGAVPLQPVREFYKEENERLESIGQVEAENVVLERELKARQRNAELRKALGLS